MDNNVNDLYWDEELSKIFKGFFKDSDETHKCTCDLYKVIMVTGCKCGGS